MVATRVPVRRVTLRTDAKTLRAQRKRREELERLYKVDYFPLSSPGMPAPGVDFLYRARELGGDVSQYEKKSRAQRNRDKIAGAPKPVSQDLNVLDRLYAKALRKLHFRMPISLAGGRREVTAFTPGHLWGQQFNVAGPAPAEVMVIGKMLGDDEVASGRNLVGPTGKYLRARLEEYKIGGYDRWYVTNLVKFQTPSLVKFQTPSGKSLRAGWVKDCLPLLHQELRLVRPKYILCMGSDASKALLGSKATVSAMFGRVVEYTYPVALPGNPKPLMHTALVMTILHPAAVLRTPDLEAEFDIGICRLGQLVQGVRFDKAETDIDHRVVKTPHELRALIKEMTRSVSTNPDPVRRNVVAVDAEWHGQHPQNAGAYLRTVQISWGPKKSACIVLREKGGKAVRKGWFQEAITLLRKFFEGKRVVGHFFNADLEWLVHAGLDLRTQFNVPWSIEGKELPWRRSRTEGGMDTGLAFHAIQETARFGLEVLSTRYTTAPRYDVPLDEWKRDYCKEKGLEASELEGYGDCPDQVLYPYANYDADVTYRLFIVASRLLDRDYDGNCCRKAYWRNMAAAPGALEINTSGLRLDRQRVDTLTTEFLEARLRTLNRLRKWAKWPEFNIRSVQHVREFLFGTRFNGRAWEGGQPQRIRPATGKSLGLDPITDTSKRPVPWEKIKAEGRDAEREHSPSTNRTTLSILREENPDLAGTAKKPGPLMLLRNYRLLNQALISVLRPPDEPLEGWGSTDEDLEYSGGILGVLCGDGCVRTHIYQTKETGRWSSARPPLMNLSKNRDKDYQLILRERYAYTIRSIFRSHLRGMPGTWCNEDTLLLEADYTGAELCGMAWNSGDPTMMDHVRRNLLPKRDPEYYDIHSNIAVLAFQLHCEPTPEGLKSIGKEYLRNVAKTVVFGVAYGRGAKAIAFAAREEGVQLSEEEAQQLIDTIFGLYPGLVSFFDECRSRVHEPRWMASCFQRYRRFPYSDDYKVQGDQERQAMNFPIQGMIADAANQAVANLYHYRLECGDPDLFRFKLQIHDAILLEVPVSKLERVCDAVKLCMCDGVPVYPSHLDGKPLKDRGPYYLGVKTEVFEHWSENLTERRCRQLGVPLRFCAA